MEGIGNKLLKNGLWFHIDGYHRMQFPSSISFKRILDSIELEKFVTFNSHNFLPISYPCSVLLLKNSSYLQNHSVLSELILNIKWALSQVKRLLGSKRLLPSNFVRKLSTEDSSKLRMVNELTFKRLRNGEIYSFTDFLYLIANIRC